MAVKPATIDAYLATVSDDRREVLQRLRKAILSILPDAQECISYSMPAFRYAGRVVAGFLATSKGCSDKWRRSEKENESVLAVRLLRQGARGARQRRDGDQDRRQGHG